MPRRNRKAVKENEASPNGSAAGCRLPRKTAKGEGLCTERPRASVASARNPSPRCRALARRDERRKLPQQLASQDHVAHAEVLIEHHGVGDLADLDAAALPFQPPQPKTTASRTWMRTGPSEVSTCAPTHTPGSPAIRSVALQPVMTSAPQPRHDASNGRIRPEPSVWGASSPRKVRGRPGPGSSS